MNYHWHYDRLIETRLSRDKIEGQYYEKHHILPKSMGGADDPGNLVYLTAREHFLAHWLLWRIHRNRSMACAFYSFVNFFKGKNHSHRPEIKSSRAYEEAREAYSLSHKSAMKGVLNSNRSKIVLQLDINGNFIKEWPSAAEAHRELKIFHITSCCRGERKWAGGFLWKYKYDELKKSKPYKKRTDKISKKKILSESNRKNISLAASDREWYNDGQKNYFLKSFESKIGLIKGRIYKRKKHGKII